MKYPHLLLVSAALVLTACGGSSARSPQGGTTTPTPPAPPASPMTACNTPFGSAAHCAQTITSPAPPSAPSSVTTPFAQPTDISRTDNGCDWEGNGVGVASDTTDLDATIYLPASTPGQTFPLIIHSHGWGGSKAAAPATYPENDPSLTPGNGVTYANTFIGLSEMIDTLRNRGYIVISFSERGWGSSEGEARVIDPCYEVVDTKAVIDWAVANLPVEMEGGSATDPLLGTIGGSYGGAFQIMLALHDTRVDTITPVATWHQLAPEADHLVATGGSLDASNADSSLPNGGDPAPTIFGSLVSNETTKRPYIAGLCALANTTDALITDACAAALTSRTGAEMDGFTTVASSPSPATDMRKLFSEHGLGHSNFDKASSAVNTATSNTLDVDVLLFQGMRDVVFNGTEAALNYEYFRNHVTSGNDVKLVTTDGGHMLTPLSGTPSTNYQFQGPDTCGSIEMFDTLLYWFDEKLKNVPIASATPAPFDSTIRPAAMTPAALPDICIALDHSNGLTLSGDVPTGDVPGAPNTGGITVTGSATVANAGVINTATSMCLTGPSPGGPAPGIANNCLPGHFVSLYTATGTEKLAGIPVLNGAFSNSPLPATPATADTHALVAIGVRRGSQITEIDEQVAAIRAYDGAGTQINYSNLLLPMVGEQLQTGDEVGIIIYAEHPMYLVNNLGSPVYTFTGTVDLPIHP